MSDNLHTLPLQETERDKYNFDVGYERGHQECGAGMERVRRHIAVAIAELDALIARGAGVPVSEVCAGFEALRRDEASACLGDRICTNPRCRRHGATAWDMHDDPEMQP